MVIFVEIYVIRVFYHVDFCHALCSGLAYVHMLELIPVIISNFSVVGRYQLRHNLGPI